MANEERVISVSELKPPTKEDVGDCERRDRQREESAREPTFRMPNAADGPAVSQLIASSPPLDTNSAYCNLLQCTDFAETCVAHMRSPPPDLRADITNRNLRALPLAFDPVTMMYPSLTAEHRLALLHKSVHTLLLVF